MRRRSRAAVHKHDVKREAAERQALLEQGAANDSEHGDRIPFDMHSQEIAMKPSSPKPDASKPATTGKQQSQQGTPAGQYGEGSYSGTKQYNEGLKEHMKNHDIEREARDAAPRDAQEERELQEAERAGKARSKAGHGQRSSEDDSDTDPNTR